MVVEHVFYDGRANVFAVYKTSAERLPGLIAEIHSAVNWVYLGVL